MNGISPLGGHRMVLAIMELADDQAAELAREYELSITSPNMPWHVLEDTRQHLWEALVRRAQRGEVFIRGVVDATAGAVTISPDALRGTRPVFLADTLTTAGTTFHSIGVFKAAGGTGNAQSLAPINGTARGKGGRPDGYDWVAFRRELVRAVWDGGLPDRAAIRAHMRDWCARTWAPPPDDKTMRDQLNPLLDPSIPDKRGN